MQGQEITGRLVHPVVPEAAVLKLLSSRVNDEGPGRQTAPRPFAVFAKKKVPT